VHLTRTDRYAACLRYSGREWQDGSAVLSTFSPIGDLRTTACLHNKLAAKIDCFLSSTNMYVDGGKTVLTPKLEEAVLSMDVVTPSPSTDRVGHVMHASHTAILQSCFSNNCTLLICKRVGHWAQGLTHATALK
jgi:hypothetical protein